MRDALVGGRFVASRVAFSYGARVEMPNTSDPIRLC
jgi:hypothetical protein